MGISTTFAVSDNICVDVDIFFLIHSDALNRTSLFLYIERYANPGKSNRRKKTLIKFDLNLLSVRSTAKITKIVRIGKIGAINRVHFAYKIDVGIK
jgi:hypothetical protein